MRIGLAAGAFNFQRREAVAILFTRAPCAASGQEVAGAQYCGRAVAGQAVNGSHDLIGFGGS